MRIKINNPDLITDIKNHAQSIIDEIIVLRQVRKENLTTELTNLSFFGQIKARFNSAFNFRGIWWDLYVVKPWEVMRRTQLQFCCKIVNHSHNCLFLTEEECRYLDIQELWDKTTKIP